MIDLRAGKFASTRTLLKGISVRANGLELKRREKVVSLNKEYLTDATEPALRHKSLSLMVATADSLFLKIKRGLAEVRKSAGQSNLKYSRLKTSQELNMIVKKVSTGQMWKNEESGEVFVVTSLYKDVLASYALLRTVSQKGSDGNKRARVIKTTSGEVLAGFTLADLL